LSADLLITYLTWAIFVLLFAPARVKAVREPLRTNIDVALLFGAPVAQSSPLEDFPCSTRRRSQ
jgi:hypothetical protein